jgi:hypothetical protein
VNSIKKQFYMLSNIFQNKVVPLTHLKNYKKTKSSAYQDRQKTIYKKPKHGHIVYYTVFGVLYGVRCMILCSKIFIVVGLDRDTTNNDLN